MTHVIPFLALTVSFAISPIDDGDPPEPLDVVSALEQAVSNAIEKARPSVVTIDRIKSEDGSTQAVRGRSAASAPANTPNGMIFVEGFGFQTIGPEDLDYASFDFGSGVVVGDRGQILTAYHVVIGAARLFVRAGTGANGGRDSGCRSPQRPGGGGAN